MDACSNVWLGATCGATCLTAAADSFRSCIEIMHVLRQPAPVRLPARPQPAPVPPPPAPLPPPAPPAPVPQPAPAPPAPVLGCSRLAASSFSTRQCQGQPVPASASAVAAASLLPEHTSEGEARPRLARIQHQHAEGLSPAPAPVRNASAWNRACTRDPSPLPPCVGS